MRKTLRQIIDSAIENVSPKARAWSADSDVQLLIRAVNSIEDDQERLEALAVLVQWAFDDVAKKNPA